MSEEQASKSGEPEAYLEHPATGAGAGEKEKAVFSGLRVSLMPAELAGAPTMDLRRALVLTGVVLAAEVVLIGVAYLALLKVTSDRRIAQDALRTELTALRATTPDLEARASKASQFSAQYAANEMTLNQHLYWSGFFSMLEQYLLPSISCTSFSGDVKTGVVNLDCRGRSYRDVAEQIVYIREKPLVASLTTGAVSAAVDEQGNVIGTTFSMRVKFKPEAWLAKVQGSMPMAAASTATDEGVGSAPVTSEAAPEPLETLFPVTAAGTVKP